MSSQEKNEADGIASERETSVIVILEPSISHNQDDEEKTHQSEENDDKFENYDDDENTVIAVKAEIEENYFDILMSELTQETSHIIQSLSISATNKEQIPETANEDDTSKRKRRSKSETAVPEIIEEEKFDPLEYYAKYDQMVQEFEFEKHKNDFLQKKVREYLIRNKKYHHMSSLDKKSMDLRRKYEKELDDLANRLEKMAMDSGIMTEELCNLRKKHNEVQKETELVYHNLMQAEKEVAKEILSHEDSENERRRKVIEMCFNRQKNQLNNLIKMRYQHIKLRNRMAETEEALNALDNLGPDCRLIDYEELKITNRNLIDKLEERENELIRIRRKCQNAVQTLAHIREKSDNINRKIGKLKGRLEIAEFNHSGLRMIMNDIMKERDSLRNRITELKNRSVLLTKPKLLRDMQNTIDEIEALREETEKIKEKYEEVAERVYKTREFLSLAS